MLNCTDVLCTLHEHHYYHHHQQHHLQDHRQHHDHDHEHQAIEPEDVGDYTSGFSNTTEEALTAHVDAPSDSLYMIFGVLIAMVLVAVIIILLAITISKLRKRDDVNNTAASGTPGDVVLHTTTTATTTTTTTTTTSVVAVEQEKPEFLGLWQYPPPQYTIYSNDKETLVMPAPAERPKFARGLRKNLSGRWKRLTKKPPTNEVYTIPADLRDQLKSIYVY